MSNSCRCRKEGDSHFSKTAIIHRDHDIHFRYGKNGRNWWRDYWAYCGVCDHICDEDTYGMDNGNPEKIGEFRITNNHPELMDGFIRCFNAKQVSAKPKSPQENLATGDESEYGDWYFYNKYGMSRGAYLCKCGTETVYGDKDDAISVAKYKDADLCMVDIDRAAVGHVHVSYHHPWCTIHSPESWRKHAEETKERWESYYGRSLYSAVIEIRSRLKSLKEMKEKYPNVFGGGG